MTRYALYFTPAAESALFDAGSRWLGRDAYRNVWLAEQAMAPRSSLSPLLAQAIDGLTAEARRYGFHATLKAPFSLAAGFDERHLEQMAHAFALTQRPFTLDSLTVGPIGSFLALRPANPTEHDMLAALSMRCVRYFDLLRAAPSAAELARRRRAGLSMRQDDLLHRWGYPYTEEQFRFHMTLTGALDTFDTHVRHALLESAGRWFAPALAQPVPVDAITVFREDLPGAPFTVWKRFPFSGGAASGGLPAPGTLFYCVGPSGAGKDSLLRWVRAQLLPDHPVVFMQRTITRPPHESEDHEAVGVAEFQTLAETGAFSMQWQANDLRYGIRRGMEAHLQAGRDVIVNGSREYVSELQWRYPSARILWIDAEESALRERMQARGREQGAALLRRMDRARRFIAPDTENVVRIDNTGSIETAGRQMLDAILAPASVQYSTE